MAGQRGSKTLLPELSVCCCIIWLLACTPQTSEQQAEPAGIVIAGMVIRNELPFPVTDVMITVPATGTFVGCGNVMQGSDCRISFEAIDYTGNAVLVSWKEYGKPHQTDQFVIDVPADFDAGRPGWLEVIIFAMGQAGTRLIQ